jgi:hypothetical protein
VLWCGFSPASSSVRGTEVRQVEIRYHFFLFTELIRTIIILTLPPLSILPR